MIDAVAIADVFRAMTHAVIADFLKMLLLIWMGALAVTVLAKMLHGEISTAGFLSTTDGAAPDPERVGLLAVTLGIAFFYAMRTLGTPLPEVVPPNGHWMPEMPPEAIYILGGGHGTYLGGKIFRLIRGVSENVR